MIDILSVGLAQLASYVLMYAFTWYITQTFSPDVLGVYFLVFAIVSGAFVFAKWGYGQGVLRFCSQLVRVNNDACRSVYGYSIKRVVFNSLFICTALIAFSKQVALIYELPGLAPALIFLTPYILLRSVNELAIQYLRIWGRIRLFTLIQYLLVPASKLLILYLAVLFLFKLDIRSIITGIIASEVIAAIILAITTGSFAGCLLSFQKKIPFGNDDSKYVNYIGFNLICVFMFERSDIILSSYFLSSNDIAIYQVGKQVSWIVTIILAGFEPIIAPAIARAVGEGDKNKLSLGFGVSVYYISLLSIPIAVCLFINGDLILSFFGEYYKKALWPMRILIIGQMINFLTGQVGYILNMSGHGKVVLYNALGTVFLTIIFIAILCPLWGVIGVATAVGTSIALINLVRIWQVWYLEKIEFLCIEKIVKLFCLILISTGLFSLQHFWAANLIGLIATCLIFYSTICCIEYYKNHNNIEILNDFINLK